MDDTVPLPGDESGDGMNAADADLDALMGEYGVGEGSGPEPGPEPEGTSSLDGFLEAARNTSPNPSLDAVESPLDMQHGGMPRIFRGLQKLLGFDGAEAWVDVVVGIVEHAVGAGRVQQTPAGQEMGGPTGAERDETVDQFDPSDLEL